MAFQKDKFRTFFKLLAKETQGDDFEYQAIAENFILEERLTGEREDSYAHYVVSPQDWGDWKFGHENYVYAKIELSKETT